MMIKFESSSEIEQSRTSIDAVDCVFVLASKLVLQHRLHDFWSHNLEASFTAERDFVKHKA